MSDTHYLELVTAEPPLGDSGDFALAEALSGPRQLFGYLTLWMFRSAELG
jgi:hypothetical protein